MAARANWVSLMLCSNATGSNVARRAPSLAFASALTDSPSSPAESPVAAIVNVFSVSPELNGTFSGPRVIGGARPVSVGRGYGYLDRPLRVRAEFHLDETVPLTATE